MPGRRLLALSAVTLAVGAVAWALIGLPGAPAACLPADCDCEAAGPGPIRQPANAWSSLALAAAGIATLIASPAGAGEARPKAAEGANNNGAPPGDPLLPLAGAEGTRPTSRAHRRALTHTIVGGALIAAGLAAFLYHAGLTAWAARLDGMTVAILIGALVWHGWYRLPRRGPRQPSPPGANWTKAMRVLAPWLLVALGGLCWQLGQSDGPWCHPDSLLQAHAAWHLLAAGAIGLWLSGEKPGRTGPQVLPPSSLMAGEPDTQ
jgi:hypothetical protein